MMWRCTLEPSVSLVRPVIGGRSIGASMDRLLRYFLGQFIRRGTMTFTAASGARFACGDGTGPPVSVRFLSERTQRRVLLNPELALGEAYMDGTFVVENGSIADALAILLDQPEMVPRWGRLQWWLRYFGRHIRQWKGGASSFAGYRARRKERQPTPDGQAAHARRQAPARRRARHAVPGAISLPWRQSASTATSAGCSPIAIPGVADPSPVLFGPVAFGNPKVASPFPIS